MSALHTSALRGLRRLSAHPRVLPLTALILRARTIRSAPAFVGRELLGRRGIYLYRLRRNRGIRVALRHRTGDIVTLGEVFHEHDYRPIPEVEQLLVGAPSIVDLGANVGMFGAFAVERWPAAQIVAFEPDPANAAVHQRTIAANAMQGRWKLIQAAAAAHDGEAAFVFGQVALSHLADVATPTEGQTIDVTVCDVLPELARADLLKMDIEGGEWAILGDPRFRESPPRTVVLEYHPRLCPGPDARDAAETALRAAGLSVRSIWHREDGHGMLWAWRG